MSISYNGGRRGRPPSNRKFRSRFLIVCEGERTEPNYFKGFHLPAKVADIRGIGANTVSLVEKTIELRSEGDYDSVWCVFDRDSFPVQNFNEALQLAERNGINVAYSNEAFEIWYLLHFHYHNAALDRTQYAGKIKAEIGRPYQKNDPEMYSLLRGRMNDAIRNAQKLLTNYEPLNPAQDNPSTTVHVLVEELRKNLPGQPSE